MAHARLIVEAVASAALGELAERLARPNSELRQWLDEVTEPPPDADLRARRTYSGLFYVIRNRIRRALVVEHRRPEPPSRFGEPRGFGPPGGGIEPDYDDEFPGFG